MTDGHPVVALVPAKDRADSVAATVSALLALDRVDEVVVIDDGSGDATTPAALAAGARVVQLPVNRGKGGAVQAGVEATPHAATYLLVDADVAGTAALVDALLDPVLAGDADMTVGVLPGAGRKGGFGSIRRLAASGIRRAVGLTPRAPLSGQRAVRASLLRELLPLAPRFGLEVGLTIDAARSGARIIEVDVAMDHRHTGRRLAGFRHRGSQGLDILRALWPRLTAAPFRVGLVVVLAVLAIAAMLWSGARAEPASVPAGASPSKVLVFGMPRLAVEDLLEGRVPHLAELAERGALAQMSVRTLSGRPQTVEGYATLGAGTRVKADAKAAEAYGADVQYEGGTARDATARRTGLPADGEVVVVGAAAATRLNLGRNLSSEPGALGQALADAGRRTAVVGNADLVLHPESVLDVARPAAIALMDKGGAVDHGHVGSDLLRPDVEAPFGVRTDEETFLAAVERALSAADVVLADPGDLDRAAEFAAYATPRASHRARVDALTGTDRLLGRVAERLDDDTLLLVVSVVPPGREWHLAPMVAVGPGVHRGYLHSPSTRRLGVVTLTDVAPTVLDVLGERRPAGMIGHALRYVPGDVDLGMLRRLDRDAEYRENTYLPLTVAYIVLQALVYLLAIFAFTRLGGIGRAGRPLRWVALGISAWPLSTFLFRAVPEVAELGVAGVAVLLAIDALVVAIALRARRHPLSPLSWILGATVALLVVDVSTGARLQSSSLLGYSLHTAARFTGFGNTAFATLAATTILWAAIHVHHAQRRREAVVTAACVFAIVVVADGAPSLGSDVGGILTLVPVFGLTLLVLAGRRISVKALAVAAALTVALLSVATVVDLARPPEARTHLGRLIDDVRADGPSAFTTTVSRKVAVNFRTYRSPWRWVVPITAAYMLYVLGVAGGWARLVPPRSALRAGVVGTLAAGLLGYAVNDSGVVVTALVFVYIGPFLTLLAITGERGEPRVLPPVDDLVPAGATA